jgi:hypothetical protein
MPELEVPGATRKGVRATLLSAGLLSYDSTILYYTLLTSSAGSYQMYARQAASLNGRSTASEGEMVREDTWVGVSR